MRYQRREVGDTEWEDCTLEQYNKARRNPLIEIRTLDEEPTETKEQQ